MAKITPGDAVTLVRRNLDELEPNGSIMYDTDTDNESLDNIIKRHLPDAINDVHLAAPVALLGGEDAKSYIIDDSTTKLADGQYQYDFSIDDDGMTYLRLVAFQTSDSPYVVSNVISAYSPEGRKQKNPYIRGRWDRPRLVQVPDLSVPTFNYYSMRTPSAKVNLLHIINRQVFNASATNYYISPLLRDNIIECLTAKVMESFGDQRSQTFYQRALSF